MSSVHLLFAGELFFSFRACFWCTSVSGSPRVPLWLVLVVNKFVEHCCATLQDTNAWNPALLFSGVDVRIVYWAKTFLFWLWPHPFWKFRYSATNISLFALFHQEGKQMEFCFSTLHFIFFPHEDKPLWFNLPWQIQMRQKGLEFLYCLL